jgi:hypothetical protein
VGEDVAAGGMAQIVCPLVSAEDRARLEAIVADRNRAQKHVARAGMPDTDLLRQRRHRHGQRKTKSNRIGMSLSKTVRKGVPVAVLDRWRRQRRVAPW